MKKYIGTKIIEAEPAYRVVDAEGNVRVVTEAAEAKRCGTVDLRLADAEHRGAEEPRAVVRVPWLASQTDMLAEDWEIFA